VMMTMVSMAAIAAVLAAMVSGRGHGMRVYSTVTDFARLRGLSTSFPRASAAW
jgi:hypothetical protein